MSPESESARAARILRYGELLMRKTREEAKSEELSEMEAILKELGLTPQQIVEELEHIVKTGY